MSRRLNAPKNIIQRVRGIQDGIRNDRKNTGWVEIQSFLHGWDNFSDTAHGSVAYMLDDMGFVRLRGLIAGGTSGQTAFSLPEGYQPEYSTRIATVCNGTVAARLDISAAGVVTVFASDVTWVALDGLSFRAESLTSTIDLIDGE